TNGIVNHTGGTTAGNPVEICGANLNATGGGSANFDFIRGVTNTVSCSGGNITGNIGATDTVRANNTGSSQMLVGVNTNITNDGTLKMIGTNDEQLVGLTQTITNNGTFEISGSGPRFVQALLNNTATGTVNINSTAGTSKNW